MEQYAIYLRKSRADMEAEKLGEGETLARHKKILTSLAAQKGLYVGKIYQEIVSGAESIKDRPEINRLIEDCYAGKYRGIIIIEVTRLSRGSQGDAQIIMDCLKFANRNQGLLVVTPTKVYDVAHSHDDEEYMEFELFMSRREYKMIKRRMDRGKMQMVVEGNYMGSVRPYGYDILKTRTARTLKIREDEAEIVKLIFGWAANENLTNGKIAKNLTAMGVPTYTGEPEWDGQTIRTILENPVYCGKIRWNYRMQVTSMIDGNLVKSRPNTSDTDHYMLYDGKHPAIIDEETFGKVAERFNKPKTKLALNLKNPLAGLLMCPKCGKNLQMQEYPQSKNTKPRYFHKASTVCGVKSAYVSDVMNAFRHALKMYLDDFELKIDNLPSTNETAVETQLNTLRGELQKVEKKLSKLFDAWEAELISDNDFVQRKAVNNDRIEEIKKQIEELEDAVPEREEYQEKIIMLSDALDLLDAPDVDAETKNNFLKQLIDRIEYTRENSKEFILDVYLK